MPRKAKLKPEKTQEPIIDIPKEGDGEPKPIGEEPKQDIFDVDGELVVDVFEDNSHFVVLAAIAGVQIKDLDISVEKDMMVIKGHRIDPHEQPEKKYFYQECYWGPFSRKIVLPENIDTQAADAQMDKGILTIKMIGNGSRDNPHTNLYKSNGYSKMIGNNCR